MRKPKSDALPYVVPYELQRAQYDKEQAESQELAERIERGESLTHHDRVFIAASLRWIERNRKPPARPRGAAPRLNPLHVEEGFRYLRKQGKTAAEAVADVAEHFSVSDAAVRAVLRQEGIRT
jgi:hypothetical protein